MQAAKHGDKRSQKHFSWLSYFGYQLVVIKELSVGIKNEKERDKKREKREKKVIEVRSGVVIFIGDEGNICFWSIHLVKMEHAISGEIFRADALFSMSKSVFVAVWDYEKLDSFGFLHKEEQKLQNPDTWMDLWYCPSKKEKRNMLEITEKETEKEVEECNDVERKARDPEVAQGSDSKVDQAMGYEEVKRKTETKVFEMATRTMDKVKYSNKIAESQHIPQEIEEMKKGNETHSLPPEKMNKRACCIGF